MQNKRHSKLLQQLNRIDRVWHEVMLRRDAERLEQQAQSARINFSIIDTMNKAARRHIDRDGPEAPFWANEWFATGEDPGHRLKSEPADAPMFPYQR